MRLFLAACLCFALGCSASSHRGHLVIAGGAVKADNQRLYAAFMAPLASDAIIGIVPTASASAAESAEASAKTIARHAAGRRTVKLDLPSGRPENASNPEIVAQLNQCSGLWFTGGVQSRIVNVFRPAGGDTPAYAAAKGVLSRGGAIGGTSAGAAMMSDPMIAGGNSEDALSGNFRTNDEDSGLGIGKGMGFFPYGLVDQHFLRRGRIGRLIVALDQTGQARGYGVEENSAIDVDLDRGSIAPIGSVAVVDVSGMKREGNAWRGVRVSLLHDGDFVDGRSGRITPGGTPFTARGSSAMDPLPAAWSAGAVTIALNRLASRPDHPVELASPGFVLRFTADAETTTWMRGDQLSVVGALLDVSPVAKGN